jgi:hypothetical protein
MPIGPRINNTLQPDRAALYRRLQLSQSHDYDLVKRQKRPSHSFSTFMLLTFFESRSQWLHGLRHELSSLARKLESWFRIPLKAWMLFVVSCA